MHVCNFNSEICYTTKVPLQVARAAVILNRHHHLLEVETHRSLPLPFRSDQSVRTLFAKKAKNEDCANRHVSSANDRFLIGTIIFQRSKHIDQCLSLLRSDQPVRTLFAKKLKIRIVPIAIGMCQVPPIACQQAQSYSRCRSTSIIVSPNPIGPAVQTVFAKRLKIKCAKSSCAKCHQSILNGHRHLPEVETHRSVPLPVAIGAAVRTLFAKGLKIRIVPIAISMCQVPPIDSQEAPPSSSRGGNTSISASPIPMGPAVRTLFV